MVNDQIEKAKRIAQQGSEVMNTMGLSDELQSIREQLKTPEGVHKALAMMRPEVARATELMSVRPEPIKPPWERSRIPLPMTATRDSSVDLARLGREVSEAKHAEEKARREREQRMIETLEAMRAELAASGRRETQATERAEAAEKRDAFMVKATVFSTAFGGLSVIAAVVAIVAH